MSFLEAYNLVGIPVVTFIAGGKKLNFILDSGATGSSIDKSILKFIDCGKPIYHQDQWLPNGTETTNPCYKLKFHYKNKSYVGEFLACDYKEHFDKIKKEFGVTIHGLIGVDFFTKHQYVLDFYEMVAYSKKK